MACRLEPRDTGGVGSGLPLPDLERQSDEELVRGIQNGEQVEERVSVLYRRLQGYVMNAARRWTHSRPDAEDIAESSWQDALRHIKLFNPDQARFRTWLWAIVRNNASVAARHRNAEQRCFELLQRSQPDSSEGPAERYERRAVADWVWERFLTLPPKLRTVLALHLFEHKTYAEAGRVLGLTERQAQYASHQATAILRRCAFERMRTFQIPVKEARCVTTVSSPKRGATRAASGEPEDKSQTKSSALLPSSPRPR